eukprot:30958_1
MEEASSRAARNLNVLSVSTTSLTPDPPQQQPHSNPHSKQTHTSKPHLSNNNVMIKDQDDEDNDNNPADASNENNDQNDQSDSSGNGYFFIHMPQQQQPHSNPHSKQTHTSKPHLSNNNVMIKDQDDEDND